MMFKTEHVEDNSDDRHLTDAGAIIEAMEYHFTPDAITLDGQRVVSMPKGQTLQSLKPFRDEYLTAPERIKGTAELTTLASFIDHLKRFKQPNTAVFAGQQSLTAVYDYHGDAPAFCAHRAMYAFPWSPEWKAWIGIDSNPMGQLMFAQFVEDHVADVTTALDEDSQKYFGELGFKLASPAQMLAMSRGLQVRVDSEAVAKANLSSGELEVSYKEQHTDAAGQPLKIPGGFLLLIPAFKQGALYRIPVRLRYRVQNGKVLWTTLMLRRDAVVQDAISDACERVVDATSVALFHGESESEKP